MRIAILVVVMSTLLFTKGAFAESNLFGDILKKCVDGHSQNDVAQLRSENAGLRDANQKLRLNVQELEFRLSQQNRPQDRGIPQYQFDCSIGAKIEYSGYIMTGSGTGAGSSEVQSIGMAIAQCEVNLKKSINDIFAGGGPTDLSSCSNPKNQRCSKTLLGYSSGF